MCFLWLLIYLFLTPIFASSQSIPLGFQTLNKGNSLSVEGKNQFLISPNGTFSSGFYRVGNNSFCFSIWFTNSFEKTIVWMANRDRPINGKDSKLILNSYGNLILTDADDSIVWSSETIIDEFVELKLLETGNLVLMNQNDTIFWQSFDFPTDTLLPEQNFRKKSTLVSMRSPGTYLSGFYYLKFNDDNVLNLIFNGPSLSSIYWPQPFESVFDNGRNRYNSSRIAVLNKMGKFQSSDSFRFNATDYGVGPKRRLSLDYDGILRLYSLNEKTGNWVISWFTDNYLDGCMVHGSCGEYGICIYDPLPSCVCPLGFTRNDPSDWTKGCNPSFNLTCNVKELDFTYLPNTDYYGYDLDNAFIEGVSIEQCRNSCLNNCLCKGFGYSVDGSGQCFPKGALRNGYRKPNTRILMQIKVSKGIGGKREKVSSNDLRCSTSELVLNTDFQVKNANKFRYTQLLIGFVAAVAIIEFIFIGFGWWNVFRKRVHEELLNMGYIVLAIGFKRFTYAELKRATKNFKQEIGKGGFGTVYKGVLDDGRVIAVKRLEGILQGDAEFWAEVSIIGKINHKNLVKLWGFCAENRHKMLVYEYVKNGSLDSFLFIDSSWGLGWGQRYKIAVGTAKGLSYLHEECLEWVLHCDVKPQNILLDEELEPKISDFGMSKLFRDINEDGFSRVRGTRGYLAPEWMKNLKIDAKADVYSYGVVLFELLSGKNASGFQSSATGKDNKCKDLVKWMIMKVEEEGIRKVIDHRLMEEYNQEMVEILLKVALLCVREDRNARPTMSKVVEILTGYNESSSISEICV